MKCSWTFLSTITIFLTLLSPVGFAQKTDKADDEPDTCPEPIHKPREASRKAKITHVEDPDFTKEAWRRGVKGRVVLRAVLCANGKVTNIEVVKGLPFGLTENAIETTRKMKFRPAQKDGRPISIAIVREVTFSNNYW